MKRAAAAAVRRPHRAYASRTCESEAARKLEEALPAQINGVSYAFVEDNPWRDSKRRDPRMVLSPHKRTHAGCADSLPVRAVGCVGCPLHTCSNSPCAMARTAGRKPSG